MSININRSRLTRSIVTAGICIVTQQRHNDPTVAILVFDILHVRSVREGDSSDRT